MVIVVALSGITGLMVPKLKGAVIIIRLGLILISAFIGLYGYILGIAVIACHLFSIRSFGVDYMGEIEDLNLKNINDTMIRGPWWKMIYRPSVIAVSNIKRQSREGEDK